MYVYIPNSLVLQPFFVLSTFLELFNYVFGYNLIIFFCVGREDCITFKSFPAFSLFIFYEHLFVVLNL